MPCARFGDRLSELPPSVNITADESPYPAMLPDAVVFAHSTEDVAAVAKLCNEHRVLDSHGAGSSLEGHILAIFKAASASDPSQMKPGAGHQRRRPATV